MWNQVVSEGGAPTTEWVFDMDGYTWVGDMLVYEEDLVDWYETELVECVM